MKPENLRNIKSTVLILTGLLMLLFLFLDNIFLMMFTFAIGIITFGVLLRKKEWSKIK